MAKKGIVTNSPTILPHRMASSSKQLFNNSVFPHFLTIADLCTIMGLTPSKKHKARANHLETSEPPFKRARRSLSTDDNQDRLKADSLPAKSVVPEESTTRPFRLLDLPQELQDNVYHKYLEGVHVIMLPAADRVPSLAIENTCKKVQKDMRRIRNFNKPTMIVIDDDCRFWDECSALQRVDWNLSNIRVIRFRNKAAKVVRSLNHDWLSIYGLFGSLRRIDLHVRCDHRIIQAQQFAQFTDHASFSSFISEELERVKRTQWLKDMLKWPSVAVLLRQNALPRVIEFKLHIWQPFISKWDRNFPQHSMVFQVSCMCLEAK